MNTKDEIRSYIFQKESSGALLLTGKWGCGKTYLLKELVNELSEKKEAGVAVISLFGLDGIDAIKKCVKERYLLLSSGKNEKELHRREKQRKVIDSGASLVYNIIPVPTIQALGKGVSTAINFDYTDLIDVKNTLKEGIPFVLAFDDFERCAINEQNLIGVINEYVENLRIRVIIIANEEKIVDLDKYKAYKEKLVSKTIRMSLNYDTILSGIIDSYCETCEGYRNFIKQNKDYLVQVFLESKTDNLRIAKKILVDFERVYEAWQNSRVSSENMCWVFYTFAAMVFIEFEQPEDGNEKQKKDESIEALIISPLVMKEYTYYGKNNSVFHSLCLFAKEDLWDVQEFVNELKDKYLKIERTPLEHVLSQDFWGLEQRDLDEGIPEAVNLAYDGKLSRKELIILFKTVHLLRESMASWKPDLDYDQVWKGLKKRMEGIKSGEIQEPACGIFAFSNEIDEEARPIYSKIESLEAKIKIWDNYRAYLKHLDQGTQNFWYSHMDFEEFDDKLLKALTTRYAQVNNQGKDLLIREFSSISFDNILYSEKDNMLSTIDNLGKLVAWIKSQKDEDYYMTQLLNKSFITIIEKEIESIKNSIEKLVGNR